MAQCDSLLLVLDSAHIELAISVRGVSCLGFAMLLLDLSVIDLSLPVKSSA